MIADDNPAHVRARTVDLAQADSISMQARETLATGMARIPAYVTTCSGQVPMDAD